VLSAIARAEPGGVAFHCASGRDRAGQVTMLLLALVGVAVDQVAADYALSAQRLTARYAARAEPDQGPPAEAFLTDRGTSAVELIAALLRDLDVEATLGDGGLTGGDVRALRRRLLDP
jgi:protein-tyrosine phosphatase